jgi:beta-mannosidase
MHGWWSPSTIDNHTAAAATVAFDADVAGRPVQVAMVVPPGSSEHAFPLRLDGIARWQPRGLGEPALHSCRVAVRCGDTVHRREITFGVRTVELVQRPQPDGGTSFIFRVNGSEMFIKGLNYTPADALLTRVDAARTTALVELAFGCNVNLLRVWGGGFYESDHFYRLCDERGILVWQDFMLGCGRYPQDDAFVAEVGREAEFQLERLRSHPSLVFLAGDNENDCFHFYAGSRAFRTCRLTRGVIRDAARSLCPELPFIASSPISPHDDNPLCPTEGDNHLWDHEAPHDRPPYLHDASRFMSEMGRLSLPPLAVIRRFIPAGQELPLTGALWKYHAADTEHVGFGERMQILLDCLAAGGHRIPATIEGLIELTQQVQADALVHWVRQYHASPVCAGIILWNLCDCWPQMSDAIIAYPDVPKPAYFALRDAYGAIPSELGKG